ncbi:hypothetical protein Emin_1330 [Elusimicrobium minutum Pei191]|uniref:Uncharacterized protein n=1 Tax=Elusimicrobium minutum (strain Pei191) TaxID=445932 RepID=B2KED4_ELUMP|nr:hypothetical protein [Elusimicrobium minutum]ACC98880.1 hypothetical protein Emin_1330 [Elusimicrobium minutum Pei191]
MILIFSPILLTALISCFLAFRALEYLSQMKKNSLQKNSKEYRYWKTYTVLSFLLPLIIVSIFYIIMLATDPQEAIFVIAGFLLFAIFIYITALVNVVKCILYFNKINIEYTKQNIEKQKNSKTFTPLQIILLVLNFICAIIFTNRLIMAFLYFIDTWAKSSQRTDGQSGMGLLFYLIMILFSAGVLAANIIVIILIFKNRKEQQ